MYLPKIGECQARKEFPSYNRKVMHVQDKEGREYVVKILEGIPEAKITIKEVKEGILKYIQNLKEIGVSCVPILDLTVTGNKLIEVESFYPADLGFLIQKEKAKRCIELLNKGLFEIAFRPLFSSTRDVNLPVGIDAAPRNYLTDGKNYFYADFVPYKIRIDDSFTLEYPEPEDKDKEVIEIGYLRHYDKRGVLLVLLTQLCKLRPELRREFEETIFRFLKDLKENEVLAALRSTPAYFLKKDPTFLKKNEEIINDLTGQGLGYLYLRDVACEIALWDDLDQTRPERLRALFKLTHLQDKPVPKENIKRVKEELINWNFEILNRRW